MRQRVGWSKSNWVERARGNGKWATLRSTVIPTVNYCRLAQWPCGHTAQKSLPVAAVDFVECRIWQEAAISFFWWRLWLLHGSLGDQGATPEAEILMAGACLWADCQSSTELEHRLSTRAFSDEDTAPQGYPIQF